MLEHVQVRTEMQSEQGCPRLGNKDITHFSRWNGGTNSWLKLQVQVHYVRNQQSSHVRRIANLNWVSILNSSIQARGIYVWTVDMQEIGNLDVSTLDTCME